MRKYHIPWRDYFLLDVNPVIRFMIFSDFLWMGAIGLYAPIFALFVEESVAGGTPAVVGIAASVYLITKSIVQIFAASIIDWIRGEKDDFWILFIFSFFAAMTPVLYLFMSEPIHLYAIQFLYGIFLAFTFPTFMAVFSRHLDKNKAGTEWGIYYTLNDLAAAVTAVIGGFIATVIGFHTLIVVSVLFSLAGVLTLFPIRRFLYR